MPTTAEISGPFSYSSVTFTSSPSNNYDLVANKTKFDPSIGETIQVYLNGTLLAGDGTTGSSVAALAANPGVATFWVDNVDTPTKVHLTTPNDGITSGTVLIKRISNRSTPQVDFAPGSVIREQDLDNSTNQTLHVAQEAMDIALQGIVLGADNEWDGKSKEIKNVAAGTDALDAVNYTQLTATEVTTLGYRDQAEADKVQTGLDRVAVAADLVATNQDTIDTAADLVATNQDTIDTAADLTLTNADVVLTHADVVLTHADVVLAEADKVQTGLDKVATNADVVLTNADVVLTHADELLTRADTVLTAADVVSTAASEVAARNSAAAVSAVYDNFADVYLGSMADGATADTGALTGATWAKDSSSIAFTGTTGTISLGQELTSTGTGYPVGANIIGSQTTTPLVISNPFTVAQSSGVTINFVGSGVYGAYNVSKDGPALNNDGDALVVGNLYFNNTDNEMRLYDGANWIAASAAGSASLLEYKFITTSGQVSSKTYSGTADVGGSLSYTQSNILVFLNGVLLKDTTDYTATNGTSIVLVAAPVLNDELTVVAFKSFTVADTVSAASGGTFSGAVTNTGLITANGGLETDTNSKVVQKGAFMQSSTPVSYTHLTLPTTPYV